VYITYHLVGSYTYVELNCKTQIRGVQVIISMICYNSPFVKECYVGHFPLFEICVVKTTF
jgi:hypothetical protein